MATVQELFVRLAAEIRDFTGGFEKAGTSFGAFVADIQRRSGELQTAGIAIGALGTAVVGFLALATREAAQAAEEQTKLAAAIANSGKAIDAANLNRLAKELAGVTRFSDEAVVGVERLLVTFGATEAQVLRLTPVVLDIARSLDRDVAGTAEAVGRALSGAEGALSRFIGQLPDGTSLSEDFGAALAQLERRFGGTAIAAGQTLPDAFLRLRNSIGDLLEVLGAPLVGPVTVAANALAGLAAAVTRLIETFPGLSTAVGVVVTLAGAFGVVAIATAAFLLALSKLPVVIIAVKAGLAVLGGIAATLVPALAAIAGPVALIAVALALVVPRIVRDWDAIKGAFEAGRKFIVEQLRAAVPEIVDSWDQIRATFKAGVQFVNTLLGELTVAILEFVIATATLDVAGAAAALQRFGASFGVAQQAADAFRLALEGQVTLSDRLRGSYDALSKSVQQIALEYEAASRQAEVFALRAEQAALEAARTQLARPGLNERQLEQIQENLAASQSRIQQRLLQEQIRANEQRLKDTIATAGKESKTALDLGRDLQEQRTRLSRLRVQTEAEASGKVISRAQETGRAVVQAEQEAARQRIATEQAVRDAQVGTMRTTLEAQRQIAEARASLEAGRQAAALAEFRLAEETRIGLFRRTVQLERDLAGTIVGVRESLLRTQAAREQLIFQENEARRRELVQRGLLSEADARVEAAREQLAIVTRQTQAQISLEQDRIRALDVQRQVEQALLVAEAEAKAAILEAETAARIVQLETNQRLREADLLAATAIARAETAAKVAEFRAQSAARVAFARQDLAIEAARGRITPQEAAARQDAILQAERQGAIATQAILDAAAARERGVEAALVLSREAVEEAKLAIVREGAVRRADIERQLATDLLRVEAQNLAARAQLVERLIQIEGQLTAARAATVDAARETRFGEILAGAQLQAADAALARLRRVQSGVTAQTEGELARLQSVYSGFIGRLLESTRPLVDAAQRIIRPDLVRGALDDITGALTRFSSGGAKIIEVLGDTVTTRLLAPLAQVQGALQRATAPTLPSFAPSAAQVTGGLQPAIEALRFLLGADAAGQFAALAGALPGRLAAIAAAYQSLGAAVEMAMQRAIDAVRRLLEQQRQVVPVPPAAPGPTPRAPTPTPTPGRAQIAQTITIPLIVDGRTIGEAALNFLGGQLVNWRGSVPG